MSTDKFEASISAAIEPIEATRAAYSAKIAQMRPLLEGISADLAPEHRQQILRMIAEQERLVEAAQRTIAAFREFAECVLAVAHLEQDIAAAINAGVQQ